MTALLLSYWCTWASVREKHLPLSVLYPKAYDVCYIDEVKDFVPPERITMGSSVFERCVICDEKACEHLMLHPGRRPEAVLLGAGPSHGKMHLQEEFIRRSRDYGHEILVLDHQSMRSGQAAEAVQEAMRELLHDHPNEDFVHEMVELTKKEP